MYLFYRHLSFEHLSILQSRNEFWLHSHFLCFWCDSLNGSLLEQGLVQSLKLIEDCLNVLLYVMDLITRINLSMFWCDCVKGSLLEQRLAPLFQPFFNKDSCNRVLFQISFSKFKIDWCLNTNHWIIVYLFYRHLAWCFDALMHQSIKLRV